ncbi:MAG: queuosine precursor transporter [Gammaproteobacteria bacterium]|nr:queuosine precursor transporter [Gammaproteobacteria bacterium]
MSSVKEDTHLKYFPLLVILLITAQLATNVLGPRTITMGSLVLPGGVWSCPLTFLLWDIITEVYGFKRAKQLIIYYLIGQVFFSILINFGLQMPAASSVEHPEYFHALNDLFRVTFSMIFSMVLGDYINCYVLDKLKIYANVTSIWIRFIGATAVGELVMSSLWVFTFYFGTSHHPDLLKLSISLYLIKMMFEVIYVIPANFIVNFLKKNESVDKNKRYVNFDPYTLERFIAN